MGSLSLTGLLNDDTGLNRLQYLAVFFRALPEKCYGGVGIVSVGHRSPPLRNSPGHSRKYQEKAYRFHDWLRDWRESVRTAIKNGNLLIRLGLKQSRNK